MEISKSVEQEYLHPMAINQLVADYTRLGYTVTKEEKIGPYRADLVARKGEETIVFEVKTGRMNGELRQKLTALSNYVKGMPNHTFRVIFATPPQTKIIEINNLDEILTTYLSLAETPEALLALSSNTVIEDVTDLAIRRINVSPAGELEITGSGVIEVMLRYGGSDGVEMEDSYPFEFTVVMFHDGKSWQVAHLNRCEVDTSSFSE